MNYTRNQKLLAFSIAALIAYQGVPESLKASAFGPMSPAVQIATATLLGGLYGLEKLQSRPHGDDTTQ